MRDLEIGDSILVGPNNKYEQVYSFGHYHKSAKAEFLKIGTTAAGGGASLEVTKDHLVFVEGGKSIAASELKTGMKLLYDGDSEVAVIESIESIVRQGIFAPFTPSGKLIVNGFQVSSYVAFDDSASLSILGVEFQYQFVSHIFESPHRLVCHVFGSCPQESYNEQGISSWNAGPLQAFQWLLLKQNIIILSFALFFGLLTFGSVAVLEFLITTSSLLWILPLAAVVVSSWQIIGRRRSSTSKCKST